MARSRKNATKRSGTTVPRTRRTPPASSPSSEVPAPNRPAALLEAENQALKARIQQLEEERDTYRNVVYAWAREQFKPEDFRRVVREKNGLPLSAFIDQLEREADSP